MEVCKLQISHFVSEEPAKKKCVNIQHQVCDETILFLFNFLLNLRLLFYYFVFFRNTFLNIVQFLYVEIVYASRGMILRCQLDRLKSRER